MVDVVQEDVERTHALLRPASRILPFVGGHDARNDVERDRAFGAGFLAVDGEGDADAVEHDVRLLALLRDVLGRLASAAHSV